MVVSDSLEWLSKIFEDSSLRLRLRLTLGKVVLKFGWGFDIRARISAEIPLIHQARNFPQLPLASSRLKLRADLWLDQT